VDTIEESAPIRRRRRHSAEFKAKAVQERWVAEQEAKNGAPEDRELMRVPQGEFIPLRIGEPTTAVPDIQIEVRRGATTISLRWPGSAAAQCAQWLQGWLR